MTNKKLTIETNLKIDDKPIIDKPLSRDILVDTAFPTTVTVPKDAPGCKKCFRVEAGLRELLKFFLLKPVPTVPQGDPTKPQDILKKGFKFYTSDACGKTDEIDLTDTQVYTDSQLDLLFGKKQLEIEKITFLNPTRHDVDVTIIQGRDLTPCDEDDASTCPPEGASAK